MEQRLSKNTLLKMFLVFSILVACLAPALSTEAQEAPFDIEAESAILIEAKTGKILFEKNADMALPPASMSKMMTEYLVLEAIKDGKFTLDTKVIVSPKAQAVKGSTVFLQAGQEVTVRELLYAVAAFSGNDASVTLAELVGGSESSFVELMNQKSRELGMSNTVFFNSSGMPNSALSKEAIAAGTENDENMMSARDTAILAQALVTQHPEILQYASTLQVPEAFSKYQLFNFNWMLPGHPLGEAKQHAYPSLDGLKTGTTVNAGYCFTGTVEREGMRLISVVMRSANQHSRFQETRKLLDYGFNSFEYKELVKAGSVLEDLPVLPVHRGKLKEVPVEIGQSLYTVIHKGEDELYSVEYVAGSEYVNADGKLAAPIAQGDVVGQVKVAYTGDHQYKFIKDGSQAETAPLVATEDVEEAGWIRLFFRAILDFFAGIWTSIVSGIKGLVS